MSAALVAVDFETSAYSGPCACAIGMARIENDVVADTFYALIRPPSPRICFTHIHGLTWPMLRNAPTFAALWGEIAAFMAGAACFIAHNAAFDKGVLTACCEANAITMPPQPFLCTLRGARRALGLASNSLGNVAAHLGIPLRHHHAGSDALACAMIFLALRERGLEADAMRLAPPRGKKRVS